MNVAEESPAEYETLLQFLYLAPVGIAQTTLDGEIVMINPLSARLLMSVSGHGGLTNLFTALEVVAPDLHRLAAAFEPAAGVVCDGLRIQVQAGVRGQRDPQVLSLSLVKLDGAQLMAVLSDVTQQVKRERLLRQNEAWLNAIFTGITDYVVATLDGAGLIDAWNDSIGRVTGYSPEAVIGKPFSIFYPADAATPEWIQRRLREADANGWSLDDGWRIRADGTRFWGSAMISRLRERVDVLAGAGGTPDGSDDGPSYCLVMRDITDQREVRDNLQRRSGWWDHLTGLANRRTFFEAGELELVRWRHSPGDLSMILFEADDVKQVSDTHGVAVGDAVLRHLAAMLTAGFREVDVVARLGGEQFAVLLPSTGLAASAVVAERLRQAVASQPVLTAGLRLSVTVSGGVATMEDSVPDLGALVERAGQCLSVARRGGGGIQCWSPAIAVRGSEAQSSEEQPRE